MRSLTICPLGRLDILAPSRDLTAGGAGSSNRSSSVSLLAPSPTTPGEHVGVSRSVRFVLIPTFALVLFGGMVGPRPAAAAGCHLEERPVFGLSRPGAFLPDAGGSELLVGQSSRSAVIPRPCSGDVPGGLERDNPAGAVALAEAEPTRIVAVGETHAPESPPVRPIHRPARLDRPPRRPA
jgi:hypothetical protein